MGTRADYYFGDPNKPSELTWVGSTAWDGYPEGKPDALIEAKTIEEYRAELARIAGEDDWSDHGTGWPWPWETSNTTDFAYTFWKGMVWIACFGRGWISAQEYANQDTLGFEWDSLGKIQFPNMKSIQNTHLGPRSGLIVIQNGKLL